MADPVMRAAIVRRFGEPAGVVVGELPRPVPGAGEVLVQVHAAPVNYVDLVVIGGTYQFLPALPFVPGKGPAGVVAAVGPGVDGLRPGDRVLAMAEIGGYAQATVARAEACYRLPDGMSFATAASLSLAYDTAWFALRERARLQQGETVLVLGASGAVGLAAVQLARAMGARVIGAVGRQARAASVLDAGAAAVVDLSVPDLRDALREQIRAANGGALADIVIDPVGGDAFDAALRALAWCGRLVVIGFAAGRIPQVKANYLLVKNIEVSGLQISDYRKRRPQQVTAAFADMFALYGAGRIRPAETLAFPLERVSDALETVRDRRADGRRVVLLPNGAAAGCA